MILPNNPALDIEALRAKIRATADSLRASGVVEERRKRPRSLVARYRAATAYLDRADDFGYPETRLPHRLKRLQDVAPQAATAFLRLYNFAFRRAREASAAQTQAIRELAEAGVETSRRLSELEAQLAELRSAVERAKGRDS